MTMSWMCSAIVRQPRTVSHALMFTVMVQCLMLSVNTENKHSLSNSMIFTR